MSRKWPVVLCYYFLFLHGLGNRDLWNSHEARAAMNASAILEGDWLLPHLHDGSPELQKPPLYYWLVALTATLTGEVNAWSVRLPAALAGMLCVSAVAGWGWWIGRAREGVIAALLLATATHFTWLARVGRIDIPLTLTTTIALLCFHAATRRRLLLPGAYVALAFAILLKGPIGPVLVAAALGTFLLVEGRLPAPWRLRNWGRLLHEYGVWWGVPLMLALALPWYLLADAASDGELTRVFFWYHNVERGLGGAQLRGHPWWLYGPRFFADFAPWSLLLPVCVLWFFRRGRWRQDRDARFGLAWLVGMTLLLSCARYKRADYLVPAYPGAALFLGCVIVRWWKMLDWRATRVSDRSDAKTPVAALRSLTRVGRPGKNAISHGRNGERSSETALNRAGVVVLVVSALLWWVRVDFVLPRGEAQLEQHSFAALVRQHAPAPEPILLFQTEAHALVFHLGKPVRVLRQWEELDGLIGVRPTHVVLPAAQAAEWRQHLPHVELEELARHPSDHEKPVVLYRARRRVCTTSQDARHVLSR